jgi:hypothetical protein
MENPLIIAWLAICMNSKMFFFLGPYLSLLRTLSNAQCLALLLIVGAFGGFIVNIFKPKKKIDPI